MRDILSKQRYFKAIKVQNHLRILDNNKFKHTLAEIENKVRKNEIFNTVIYIYIMLERKTKRILLLLVKIKIQNIQIFLMLLLIMMMELIMILYYLL
jgi:effector-binding domain-containing protein